MKPFERAEQEGLEAALAGFPSHVCPYKIAPHGCNRRNGGTWGAVWRNRWLKGYYRGKERLMMKFPLGRVVATPGALEKAEQRFSACLSRHVQGDWGVVHDEDKASNDRALQQGGRLLSAYPIDLTKPCDGSGENTLWILTEADRSVTTLLLPSEY